MRAVKKLIDLRSDTVSRMSNSMLKALQSAEVGDDVYSDDPTLKRLESTVAHMLGKERGLFTISGTMSNLISILVHCTRGDSAIIGERSHINIYEQGGISSIASIFPIVIPESPDGTLDISTIKKKILPENPHFSPVKLVCLENTHNYLMGKALPLGAPQTLSNFSKEFGIKTHIDGSRILNAYYHHKANNPLLQLKELTEGIDSLCMCLSKALRCPIGSVLVGSDEFIHKALRWRKVIGGGIRQGGYVAAAALQSIGEMEISVPRDNYHATLFAKELKRIGVESNIPDTNIVVFRPVTTKSPQEYSLALQENGVLANPRIDGSIRIVFHPDIDEEDLQNTIGVIEKLK